MGTFKNLKVQLQEIFARQFFFTPWAFDAIF
jgi:hypothetical protein